MNIKKIWKSYDFRNNKVLNTKCDTPTDAEHVTNKKYVDDITTYDTPKAFLYKIPFKFNWLKNVYNLTYKQLFDDLLFPRVLPDYFNPTYTEIESVVIGKSQNIDGKGLLFDGVFYSKNKIIITHKPNDRIATSTATLTITPAYAWQGAPLIIRSDSTDNNRSEFSFDFVYRIGCKIEFSLEFNPCIIMRKDTYNEDYRPIEFNQPFILKQDITKEFEKMIIHENCIFGRWKDTDTWASFIDGKEYAESAIVEARFVNTNLKIEKDQWNYYDLLIPKSVFNCYEFWLACLQDSVGVGIIEHKLEIEKRNLLDMKAKDGDKDKIIQITIGGIPYVVCNLNLGHFDDSHIMRIMLNRVFINY